MFNGHKLSRQNKGARRLISDKFIDTGNFYIRKLSNYENYWETQRFYIQEEINRMRTKNEVSLKKN